MSGTVLGEFLLVLGADVDRSSFERALRNYPLRRAPEPWSFRRLGPGVDLLYQGEILLTEGDCGCAGVYHLAPEPGGSLLSSDEFQARVVRSFGEGRIPVPPTTAGRFCYAAWNLPARRIAACTDPFRGLPLYVTSGPGRAACATDLRWLYAAGLVAVEVDPHALYHYLNFGYVPTPFSIVKGVEKVPPGCAWTASEENAQVTNYWNPHYSEDLISGDEEVLAGALRHQISETVLRYRPDARRPWGAFLSGGTDSSSIAGILSMEGRKPGLSTFSIGYEEAPYNELPYVEIASSRFGLDSHRKIMSASEGLDVIPRLLEGFDEPFGNSGAIPTYLCAAHARSCGVEILLAGDGGDEVFGGNDWYRKNRILGWFYQSPRTLKNLTASLLRGLDGVDDYRIGRMRNFVRRGSLPNPQRLYAGDSFASQCFEELLTVDFRALVRPEESLELLEQTYAQVATGSELHRLMYVDLKRTIADSDIIKVGRASRMAGLTVVYPYLDPALVDYTGRLPAIHKLRGLEKRYLFKKAVRDVLPTEIRGKKKQGFDLPMAIWLRTVPEFQHLMRDTLLSKTASLRRYCNATYIQELIEKHQKGAWDYSVALYRLLMLELWHRSYVDRR